MIRLFPLIYLAFASLFRMFIELIELLFLLLKAFLLSGLYTAACIGMLFTVGKLAHPARLKTIAAFKYSWAPVFLILFISLLIYRFSYKEDRGIGEYARVPVGFGCFIENCDGQSNCIKDDEFSGNEIEKLEFDKFYKRGSVIYAKTTQLNPKDPTPFYFYYDLKSRRYHRIGPEREYVLSAHNGKAPETAVFYSFGAFYRDYWSRRAVWKSWLLL